MFGSHLTTCPAQDMWKLTRCNSVAASHVAWPYMVVEGGKKQGEARVLMSLIKQLLDELVSSQSAHPSSRSSSGCWLQGRA